MENETAGKILVLGRVTPQWSAIIKQIEQNIGEPLKEQAHQAVAIFRKILGERFFHNGADAHPLQRKWGNIVPWQMGQLCAWANVLQQLQRSAQDTAYLSGLLKNTNKCQQEGLHFLNVASALFRAGLSLKFLQGKHDGKSPDIEVSDPQTGEVFYIEVTHLEKNLQYKQDTNNYNRISNACFFQAPFLLTSVTILRSLSKEEAQEAVLFIEAVIRKVQESGALEVFRHDYIDIAFAPSSAEVAFNAWLGDVKREKGVHGVEVNPDETKRLTQQGRIEKKIKQLPPSATGIIYIGVECMYLQYVDPRKTMVALKIAMAAHPRLQGIVLCSEVIDFDEDWYETLSSKGDLYARYSQHGHTTLYLYCINDHYKGNVSASVLNQFRNSLVPKNLYSE